MDSTALQFSELIATARLAGFELFDARGLPVDEEHQAYLEDENLAAEPAQITFLSPSGPETRGEVAVVTVRQQQFILRGEWRRVGQLQHLLGGARAPASRRPDTP